jgi:hypothetical protein
MLIWSGWGFLVGVFTFGCSLLAEMTVEAVYADDQFYQEHHWPIAIAFSVAAAIIAGISPRVHRKEQRILLDPETGQEVLVGQRSSFFFVPMKYWPPILFVLAAIALLTEPR